MPSIFEKPITRKSFIRKSLGFTGAVASMGIIYDSVNASDAPQDLHIALASDTHIRAYQSEQYRGFFPYRNLQTVVKQINEKAPEMMLINGDVARLDGQLGDYVAINEILDDLLDVPVVMTLGNHDDRENFYNIMGQDESDKLVNNKHILVIEQSGLKMILLDSLMFVNKTPGLLGLEQREWLQTYLSQANNDPIFVFFHHTPYDKDSDLLDSDRLFVILKNFPQVKAVFFGHSHVYNYIESGNLMLINLPAVGYNFSDNQPVGWIEAKINPQRGEFTLHAIGGNMGKDGERREVVWK